MKEEGGYMRKISCSFSKVLKLCNVLKYKSISDEENDLSIIIEQMQSYIRSKGACQIGPLIQYTRAFVNEENELDFEIILMLQCNNFIYNVEPPYYMESILRVPNCMYCRYIGPEDKMSLAYQKIQIEAFENDIPLGCPVFLLSFSSIYTLHKNICGNNFIFFIFIDINRVTISF